MKADFKSVSSTKQIVRHAKRAIREQGAEIVLFEFNSFSSHHIEEIEKRKNIGIHGLFYIRGTNRMRKF